MNLAKDKIFLWGLAIFLIFISILSFYFMKPQIEGDTPSYLEAIKVLNGSPLPPHFIPNRILTTYGALVSVIFFSKIFGSVFAGWFFLNLIFYFILSFSFYFLALKIFKSQLTAFFSTLFLASNYAILSFGLTYLMDIGGWAFYLLSIFFTYRYVESRDYKKILLAGISIGVGGLFKEYAFLACIPVGVVLIYEYWRSPFVLFKKASIPALFALLPTILVYFYVFRTYDYSYLDWLSFNRSHYVYHSRIVEYIKSLGSLYNFLSFVVLGGIYSFVRFKKDMFPDKKTQIFLLSIFLSILPIFFWPAITQRILFITVPAMLLLAAIFFRRYEKYWLVFLLILILYIVSSFTMDSYILPNFNLPF